MLLCYKSDFFKSNLTMCTVMHGLHFNRTEGIQIRHLAAEFSKAAILGSL